MKKPFLLICLFLVLGTISGFCETGERNLKLGNDQSFYDDEYSPASNGRITITMSLRRNTFLNGTFFSGVQDKTITPGFGWTVSTKGGNKIITATSKKNGASIIFPLTGYKEGDSLKGVGVQGYIWSSERVEESPSQAWILGCNMKDNEIVLEHGDRGLGFCVRGVRR